MRAERLFAIILLAAFLVIAGRAHATARKEQPEAKTPGVAQKHPVRVSPYTVWRHQHDESERGTGSHQAQRPQGQMKARRLPN